MNEIVEMIVEPTPQWIKEAGKEIAQKYSLRSPEHIFVGGIIAKHFRKFKQDEKSRSNTSSVPTYS